MQGLPTHSGDPTNSPASETETFDAGHRTTQYDAQEDRDRERRENTLPEVERPDHEHGRRGPGQERSAKPAIQSRSHRKVTHSTARSVTDQTIPSARSCRLELVPDEVRRAVISTIASISHARSTFIPRSIAQSNTHDRLKSTPNTRTVRRHTIILALRPNLHSKSKLRTASAGEARPRGLSLAEEAASASPEIGDSRGLDGEVGWRRDSCSERSRREQHRGSRGRAKGDALPFGDLSTAGSASQS